MERRHITLKSGHKLYKPALQDRYCIFSPNGTWLGWILDKGDLRGFLACGSFNQIKDQS